MKTVDKNEKMPELQTMLEENFLQDDKGRWYVPDITKEGDLAKLREKNLWREFRIYCIGIKRLHGFFSYKYIYPIVRLCLKLMPTFVVKWAYNSRIRRTVTDSNKNSKI